MASGLFYLNSLDRSISSRRGVRLFFLNNTMFFEIRVFNENSVNPDQTPHNAASDLGLHCFPMTFLWDARPKCVNPP